MRSKAINGGLGFELACVLEAGEGLALRQTRSKRKHPRHVEHFDLAIPVRRLADRHLAALVRHLSANLERGALHLAFFDVTRLTSQVVVGQAAKAAQAQRQRLLTHKWGWIRVGLRT